MDLREQEAPHGHLASTSEPGARYKFFISSISHTYPGLEKSSLHGNAGLQETEG